MWGKKSNSKQFNIRLCNIQNDIKKKSPDYQGYATFIGINQK